jgi:hypothetical protein
MRRKTMQRIETKPVWATAPRAFLTVLGVSILSMSSPAQAQMNPCPYTNDGDCDEPNGLGYCAWGTDTADCSNPYSNFGSGRYIPPGSGGYTPPVSSGGLMNPCPYTNDGDCDEPNGLGLCAWGTDTADCSSPYSNYGSGSGYSGGGGGYTPPVTGGGGGGLMNPCPYTNDGDCDEPNGLGYCAWGTDTADCSNPYSNYGSGSGYAGGGTGQPQPPVTGTPGVNVTGTWNINANGWRGTLTITPIGGSTLTGNINFGSQEPITDVSYNAATGQLYFERPQVTQTYTGQVSGNQITGTFTYSGATYNWSASR